VSNWPNVITGTVGVAGILGTYLTGRGQRALERQRMAAEDRRNRRDAYHGLLAALNQIDTYCTGYPPTDEAEFRSALIDLNRTAAAVELYCTERVLPAFQQMQSVLNQIGPYAVTIPGTPSVYHRFQGGWVQFRDQYVEAEKTLVAATRRDAIGR
jgi:hypothetical protein